MLNQWLAEVEGKKHLVYLNFLSHQNNRTTGVGAMTTCFLCHWCKSSTPKCLQTRTFLNFESYENPSQAFWSTITIFPHPSLHHGLWNNLICFFECTTYMKKPKKKKIKKNKCAVNGHYTLSVNATLVKWNELANLLAGQHHVVLTPGHPRSSPPSLPISACATQ